MTEWEKLRGVRRRLEDQIRKDCAELERLGAIPEEVLAVLIATSNFWRQELQIIRKGK